MPRTDQRSTEAQAYRKWYKTYRWQQRRKRQLEAEPLCAKCKAAGRVTIATVADHVERHNGDPVKFWTGKLQSLCDAPPWRCHSSAKQAEELGTKAKVVVAIGQDGWPIT